MNPVVSRLHKLILAPAESVLKLGRTLAWPLWVSVAVFVASFLLFVFSLPTLLTLAGLLRRDQTIAPDHNVLVTSLLFLLAAIVTSAGAGLWAQQWLTPSFKRRDDIDGAWQRGINSLRAEGIDLKHHPLFVILGVSDTHSACALMQASRLNLKVTPKDLPDDEPLVWFAAEKADGMAVFLFLNRCCQTSLITNAGVLGQGSGESGQVNRTIGSFGGSLEQDSSATGGIDPADVSTPDLVNEYVSVGNMVTVGEPHEDDLNHLQTYVGLDEPVTRTVAQQTVKPISIPLPYAWKIGMPRPADITAVQEKLESVCRLLKSHREPECPVNGIICSVSYPFLTAEGEGQGRQLGQITRADLTLITRELGTRAHVIALVHGLDHNEDFPSLVRRLRNEAAGDVDRRVGKGMGTWMEISQKTLEDLAVCSCDTFQRLIYRLLMTAKALKRVDNGRLYRLISTIRSRFLPNLRSWLVASFAPVIDKSGDSDRGDELPQLAGCYFVAAQSTPPQSRDEELIFAHVTGVFERLFELESEREWTVAAHAHDSACRKGTRILFFLTVAAVVTGLIGLLRLVSGR